MNEEIMEIAEFMDVQVRANMMGEVSYRPDKYWDVLIPVLAKISSVTAEDEYDSDRHLIYQKIFINIENWIMSNDIMSVYNAVVEYIQWYNKQ